MPSHALCVEHLEADFWTARESLRTIYNAAMSGMGSPWAVLAYCAARALTLVRPHVVLPPLVGRGGGSLNWFVNVVSISAGGKGTAHSIAKGLVPGHVEVRGPGSGEGTVQAYIVRGCRGAPDGQHEAIMFDAAEVENVAALGARSGSTLMPVLRQGFSGETLGFAYSDPKKANHIKAHSYRMTLVMSVQPACAGWIFDGAAGGTPQRFMWFPAKDRRATKAAAEAAGGYVGELALPELGEYAEWQRYPRTLVIPAEAADLIRTERERSNRDRPGRPRRARDVRPREVRLRAGHPRRAHRDDE